MAHKTWNTYLLAIYRKSVLIPGLEPYFILWHESEGLVLHPEIEAKSQRNLPLPMLLKLLIKFLTIHEEKTFIFLIQICK